MGTFTDFHGPALHLQRYNQAVRITDRMLCWPAQGCLRNMSCRIERSQSEQARCSMAKREVLSSVAGSGLIPFFTPELIEAQGKNDRELLTLSVKLMLDAKEQYPTTSFQDLSNLMRAAAAGCGSCCCPCGCGSCCCASNFSGVRFQGDPAPTARG